MHLLQISAYAERIQEVSFGLSLLIAALFLLEYKKYAAEIEREEMIDNFLND